MKDKVKEILRTSYTGMDLNEDLAAERILNLFGVIVESCPDCGDKGLIHHEHVSFCTSPLCNWIKEKD